MKTKPIQSLPLPEWFPETSEIEAFFQCRMPMHRYLRPHYKLRLLDAIARLLPSGCQRVLDLGAGDGLMASAVKEFFPVQVVRGVDVVDRLHPAATVDFQTYDGTHLPFGDGEFDVVLTCNVLHHVPPDARINLVRDMLRVSAGTLVIKDHLAHGPISRASLKLADWVGNAPFGGMVEADYLDAKQWDALADATNLDLELFDHLGFQRGLRNLVFPDRNEIVLRMNKNS